MPYVDPETVAAPQSSWKLSEVLLNTGLGDEHEPGWSVCRGEWDGQPAIGVRWNGTANETSPGNPQSRGHATWFILPDQLCDAVLGAVDVLNEARRGVVCTITSPKSYDVGAWQIKIELSESKRQDGGADLVFPIPKIHNGMCRPDRGFLTTRSDPNGKVEICGKFVAGVWQGHLYTYDLHETKSASDVEGVRQLLIEIVSRELADSSEPDES